MMPNICSERIEIVLLLRIIHHDPKEGVWIQTLLRDCGLTTLFFPSQLLEGRTKELFLRARHTKAPYRPLWIYGVARLGSPSTTRHLSALPVLYYQPKGACSRLDCLVGGWKFSWKLYQLTTSHYMRDLPPTVRYDVCLALAISLNRTTYERLQEVWLVELMALVTLLGLEDDFLSQEGKEFTASEYTFLQTLQDSYMMPPSDPQIWKRFNYILEAYLAGRCQLFDVRD